MTRQRASEILLGGRPFSAVRELYPDIIGKAESAQRDCPIKMGGAGDIDLLFSLANHLQAKRIVETGVAYGWSSLALLLAIADRPDAQLISTNLHYRELGGEEYVGCVVPEHLRRQWIILRAADATALPEAIARLGSIDLCHYDSDKSYVGRLWAYSLTWKALRVGGLLISDDVGDNLAFAHFCRMAESTPVVLRCTVNDKVKYVGVLLKSIDRPLREMLF